MSQINTGIRSILSNAFIYESFQKIMGMHKVRKELVSKYITPYNVDSILDIGCGPADILEFLPKLDYHGFDISNNYINTAKKKFGNKGSFYAKALTCKVIKKLPDFDVVLMNGVLHHLDDSTAREMIKLSKIALRNGGRLLTLDTAFAPNQNPIARFLSSIDRGKNVRTAEGYLSLTEDFFSKTDVAQYNKSGIPITLCIMECTK
tara:strand:+ start:1146 stop:1760 length:615 start_codon:yes stop_codon:yes gene_type:complete